jgi:CelD/BcsL family acetyltransferase involved in cellulose biosynthesis
VPIERHDAIASLAPEWEELANRSGASPLVRPGWFEAWWAAFGAGALEVIALRRHGRLAAVLPLRHYRFGAQSLTNWHTGEFAVVAEDDAAREELFDALLPRAPSAVTLGFLDREGADLAACRHAAQRHGRLLMTRPLARSPYVEIDRAWDAYMRGIDKQRRNDIRRCRRRLEEQGELSVRFEDGRECLMQLLEAAFEVERSSWKGDDGTAIASHPDTREFYTRIANWSADRGWLRLNFLELDGRPLAFSYVLQDGGVAYLLKIGYDDAFRKFGPGILLQYETLARAFDEGLERFELLGTDTPHKLIWTRAARERVAVQLFARTPLGASRWALQSYGRPLAKRARSTIRGRVGTR